MHLPHTIVQPVNSWFAVSLDIWDVTLEFPENNMSPNYVEATIWNRVWEYRITKHSAHICLIMIAGICWNKWREKNSRLFRQLLHSTVTCLHLTYLDIFSWINLLRERTVMPLEIPRHRRRSTGCATRGRHS